MGRAVLVGTANVLRVWRYDSRRTKDIQPAKANDLGSVSVRIFLVPARLTDKEISRSPVCPFGVSALVALLAGVAWINEDSKYTSGFRFVGDELAKLSESPAMQGVTLVFSSPYPFTNAIEFFECNPAPGAFGQRYNAFRNYMIRVSRKTLLFSATPFQKPFGAFSALLLEFAAQSLMAMSNLIKLLPAVAGAIGIEGDIRDAKIDSEQISRDRVLAIWNFDCDMKIELAVTINQIALAPW